MLLPIPHSVGSASAMLRFSVDQSSVEIEPRKGRGFRLSQSFWLLVMLDEAHAFALVFESWIRKTPVAPVLALVFASR